MIAFSTNIATLDVDGIDFEASYAQPVFSGNLKVRLVANYLMTYDQRSASNFVPTQYAGNANGTNVTGIGPLPNLRATLSAQYTVDRWAFSVQERFIGSLLRSTSPTIVYADNSLPAQFYTDINVAYDLTIGENWKGQVFLNVVNLFAKKPPLFPSSAQGTGGAWTLTQLYDIAGTPITAGIRLQY